MTGSTQLERRYRRLLTLFPQRFRREHGEEMVSVLLAGATPDQTRPRPAETLNLVVHAFFMRIGSMNIPSNWEQRHANVMFPARILIGAWLLILTAVLFGSQRSQWWALLLVPAAGAHFYLAYRLRRPFYQT
jgi:hypothetical protein